MSVDFTARLIIGFEISQKEMDNLYTFLDDDEEYDMLRDEEYILNPQEEEYFFVIKDFGSTDDFMKIAKDFKIGDEEESRWKMFLNLFPHRNDAEAPDIYLMQEVY